MSFKVIFKITGILLLIEIIFILISLFVSLIYGEADWTFFIQSIAIIFVFAFILLIFSYKNKNKVGKKEGYVIVSSVWVVFSIFGALPFYLSGAIPSYTDAFFETMSGFTTTGASILNDIESLSHGLLFWRSLTQWLGGMGIIVLSLAILPLLGIGGIQLFIAEVPGPTPDKLHPKVAETAKRLWGIYVIFTITQTFLLWIGGMSFFDSINHSFTTMATGGYSTKQASIAYWDSAYIQYVITFFMFLAGTNFTISYLAFHKKWQKIWVNEEFRYYTLFTLGFTLIITFVLFQNPSVHCFEKAFRDSLFQVVSIMTTTGYATADYLTWPVLAWTLIFIIMFFGGSAGSTGGGVKIIRILIALKNSFKEFKRLVHPQAVIPVRVNGKALNPDVLRNILAFIVVYIMTFALGTIVMTFFGLDFDSAMGSSITTLGNIGPGIGSVGPAANFYHIPTLGKWFLSFLMLIGRLELFTVLIIFSPLFWKK